MRQFGAAAQVFPLKRVPLTFAGNPGLSDLWPGDSHIFEGSDALC